MAVVFGLTAADIFVLVIASFAGGAFGASLGALPAFCFTGIMVLVGEAASIVDADVTGAAPDVISGAAGAYGTGIVGPLAFGPVFGPHVAFAGGVAAAAYAAKHDGMYEPDDGDYHPAKDIAYALGTRPDILAVGGLFGVFGMVVRQTSGSIGVPIDPPAAGVVLSAVLARLVFGYPVVGRARGRGLFDMAPFESGEKRTGVADGGSDDVATDGGTVDSYRFAVEPWLPHQYKWSGVTMIGLVTGILGAYIFARTGSLFIPFGISAASLLFLNLWVEKIPVTHHMTLPATFVASMAMTDGMGVPVALLLGAAFGVLGALFGEVYQRIFYAHSDTHFDPPAASIVTTTLILGLLAIAGVFSTSGAVPLP
jgi:MFS family permease